jgi:adhesin transport system membrane fusion protein
MREGAGRLAIDLQPGMTATVEILTGQMSLWAYLTKPIFKTLSHAMQER